MWIKTKERYLNTDKLTSIEKRIEPFEDGQCRIEVYGTCNSGTWSNGIFDIISIDVKDKDIANKIINYIDERLTEHIILENEIMFIDSIINYAESLNKD